MEIFGKSDKEMKQFAAELDKRQIDLDAAESKIKRLQASLDHALENVKGDRDALEQERREFSRQSAEALEQLATDRASLEKRRLELCKVEAEAKAGFAELQRETFAEVFEKRQAGLDAIKKNLDLLSADVSKRLEALHSQEGDLARRELVVTEREQKADAGFADKANALAEEATRQHKANQDEAERLRRLADAIAAERKDLEDHKSALVQREHSIITAEQTRDAGFADIRAALQTEVASAREQKLSSLEAEITELRSKRLEEVTKAEQSERERIHAEIAKEREAWTTQQDETRKRIENERTEFEKQKGAVSALQSEVEGRKAELEKAERMIERKDQRSEQLWQKRNDEIDESVEARLEERRKSMEVAEAEQKLELSRLRDALRIQAEELGGYKQYESQFGGQHPAVVLRDLNSIKDENQELSEKLATRPTEEMRERNQALELEANNQKARADKLALEIAANNAAVADVADLRRSNSELSAENKSLDQKATIFEGAANEAQAELSRLRTAYERPAEVEARYKEIEMPHIKADSVKPPREVAIDELKWLDAIGQKSANYGLSFNKRILNAFHTALKTAEWSPITILAGVSGTGKSELPRLYSHFGGLMFESLSVQPNWDSQESMLGFFNSIDNKFDAQPLLRFLAQSQKKWIDRVDDNEGYPGLQDAVCLVLLDEMNLAHPELYFAEFLSKLELRRGKKGSDVPFLPVKIGAGMPPYKLPLGRNVLWAGTMNQDETTKSLSDKVLDRSIIVNFPRPSELKRRLKLTPLDEKNRGTLLHKDSWQSWLTQGSSFTEDDVKPFKDFLEELNKTLAVANRAIGHRVWQSVEYYMANYPDVRLAQKENDKDALAKALHIAFEDQIVQKVMPKLRGIDTRGKSQTECLDKILGQISNGIGGNSFNLTRDFELACELGYGQFMWQSANYLNESESYAPRESNLDVNDRPAVKTDPAPSESSNDSIGFKKSSQPGIRENVLYVIKSVSSGKVLDVPGGKMDNGLKIQQWDSNAGNSNQHWKFTKIGKYYAIVSDKTGKCLDVSGGSTEDKADVVQWDSVFEGSPAQRLWMITPNPGGNFTIFAKHSGKCLSAPDSQNDKETGNGAIITQYTFNGGENQKWYFEDPAPSKEGEK
jgi:hypothetical protein